MLNDQFVVIQSKRQITPSMDNLGGLGGLGGIGMSTSSLTDADVSVNEATLSSPSQRMDVRRDPSTVAVAPVMPMKLIKPVDAGDLAGAQALSGSNAWGIEATKTDQSSFDGTGITVAVLDTGIDPTHPAFQGVQLERKNFTTSSDDDVNGHGTHCAGTVFGHDVDGKRIGIARGIDKALIGKVLGENEGDGSSLTIANAIQWAVEKGAHVVSMSLGIDFPGVVNFLVNQQGMKAAPATSLALQAYRANVNMFGELAGYVHSRGTFGQGSILIAASGNESQAPNFQIAVAPPAAGIGMLAVGALGQGDAGFKVANFSNIEVDLAAPGVGVLSAVPGGGLESMNGTSMATPHVAGIAALWAQKEKEAGGSINTRTLTARLVGNASVSVLDPATEAEEVGAGMVQAP